MKIEDLDQPEDMKKCFYTFSQELKGMMLLAGKNGTGKTTIADAIFENCRNFRVDPKDDLKLNYTQSGLHMKFNEVIQEYHNYNYLFERLSRCRLLIIDDLASRKPTDAFGDFLFAIFQYREKNKHQLATIITTNCNSIQLRNSLGDAIVSRLGSGIIYRFEKDDRRYRYIDKF